jgi:hypothetical protein
MERFGRKWSWLNQGTISVRSENLRIADVLAETGMVLCSLTTCLVLLGATELVS